MKRDVAPAAPSKLGAWLVFLLIVLFCIAAAGHLAGADMPIMLGGF
ncbi:hypothetical protein [Polaromonas sp.]